VTVFYPSDTENLNTIEPYGIEETGMFKRELEADLESEKNPDGASLEDIETIVQEMSSVRVYKTKDAAPFRGKFPVILFEHGYGVTACMYQSIFQELVSHGYIVVATHHPSIADTVIFEDGTHVFAEKMRDKNMFDTYFDDARFIFSKLPQLSPISEHMDLEHIGMMGHSFGGMITIKTVQSNPEIKAGIQLDAPLNGNLFVNDTTIDHTAKNGFPFDDGSKINTPFCHIFAQYEYRDNEWKIADYSKTVLKKGIVDQAIIENTYHNAFADHVLLKDLIPIFKIAGCDIGAGPSDGFTTYHTTTTLIREFFDKVLKLSENPLQDRGLKPYFNTLCGSQCFLRPVFPEDYTAFLPVFMNEDQMKHLGSGKPITMEKAKEYTESGVRENDKIKPIYFSWAIITHQGIAGRVFITNTTEEYSENEKDKKKIEKELGYFICPAFAGRGLATDASRLAMDSLEGPFMATVHPKNIGSCIVLKKLGYRADPTRMGGYIPKYDSVRDYYILQDNAVDTSGSLGDVLADLVPWYK